MFEPQHPPVHGNVAITWHLRDPLTLACMLSIAVIAMLDIDHVQGHQHWSRGGSSQCL